MQTPSGDRLARGISAMGIASSPLTPFGSTPQSSMARKFCHKTDQALRKSQLLQRCLDSARKSRQDKFAKFRGMTAATPVALSREEARQIIRRQAGEDGMHVGLGLGLGLSEEELVELEAAVCKELMEAEERLLRQHEEMERLEAAAQEASALQYREDAGVLCPLCTRGYVGLAKGVFSCQCGFRLDAVSESITLEQFRQALAKAHEGHASSGKACMATPTFSVHSNYGGVPLLMLRCTVCQYFQVV